MTSNYGRPVATNCKVENVALHWRKQRRRSENYSQHWQLFVRSVKTSMAARKHFGDSIEVKFCSYRWITHPPRISDDMSFLGAATRHKNRQSGIWWTIPRHVFFSHRILQVTTFIRYRYGFAIWIQRMDYGIAWMETEPKGITKWKWTWHIMDGIGAKWHYTMDTDMEYYGWKRSRMVLYNGIGHGILWMETEPGM